MRFHRAIPLQERRQWEENLRKWGEAKIWRGNYGRKRWSSPGVLTAASVLGISTAELETREKEKATIDRLYKACKGGRKIREYREGQETLRYRWQSHGGGGVRKAELQTPGFSKFLLTRRKGQAGLIACSSPRAAGNRRLKGPTGLCVCMLSDFSCVQLFVTAWSVACQAPLSMEFSR